MLKLNSLKIFDTNFLFSYLLLNLKTTKISEYLLERTLSDREIFNKTIFLKHFLTETEALIERLIIHSLNGREIFFKNMLKILNLSSFDCESISGPILLPLLRRGSYSTELSIDENSYLCAERLSLFHCMGRHNYSASSNFQTLSESVP